MNRRRYTSVEQQVEYGLARVDRRRKVKVSLRDLLYVRNTLSELIRFFHQPEHYPKLADVERFIGNRNAGALHLIRDAVYKRMRKMIPGDIDEAFNNGYFDHPSFPYYYKAQKTGRVQRKKSNGLRRRTQQ